MVIDDVEEAYALTLEDIAAIMYRAHYAQSRIAEMEHTAKAEEALVARNLKDATEVDRRTVADAVAQAEQFMRARLKTLHKSDRKSVAVTFGDITSREMPPKVEQVDPEAVFEWAKAYGYTRVVPAKEETDWAAVRKLVLDGTDIPGVTVEVQPAKIEVTIRSEV